MSGVPLGKTYLKSKLNLAECKRLIAEVELRPCLWDDADADFRNPAVTRRQWAEIGQIVQLPGELCKRKWKNLKDTFRKKVQNDAASPYPFKKWRFEAQMEFTREMLNPAKDDGFISGVEIMESMNSNEELVGSTDVIEIEEKYTPPEEPAGWTNVEEIESCSFEEARPSTCNVDVNVGVEKRKEKSSANRDDHHFFLSLLPHVTRLDDLERLQLRANIMNCVIQAVTAHEAKQNEGG